MSADSKQAGLAGGLKGILLVAALGVAYLVQKFTGIDILSKLQGQEEAGNGTVAEAPAETPEGSERQDSGDFRIPDRPKDARESNRSVETHQETQAPKQAPRQDPKSETQPDPSPKTDDGVEHVYQQFKAQRSKVWVTTQGEVVHILPDDNYEPRHQQFLLELKPDFTSARMQQYKGEDYEKVLINGITKL